MALPFETLKDAESKLQECADHLTQFNDWEQHFIEENTDQLERTDWMSDKQLEILDQLYDKIK